ncbi:MAG: Xaa-Pro aminopeptidase [Erysipelotrichales bacterium]|nr:Xaa-Pro aminopeptidase [Erysipelotrichales bacterium]
MNYQLRREIFLNNLKENSIAIFFSGFAAHKSCDAKFHFHVNRNFYYLTGIEEEGIALVLIKTTNKMDGYLYIKELDPAMALWVGETISKEEASNKSMIKDVRFIKKFQADVFNFLQMTRNSLGEINNLYLDLENRYPLEFTPKPVSFAKEIKEKFPHINIENSYNIITDMRTIKDESEIKMIKEAIKITDSGIQALMKNVDKAKTEKELEFHYVKTLYENNTKESFNTIAACGKNATILHYEKNNAPLDKNALILFDLGCLFQNYASDISRTFPLNGKFTKRQKEIYQVVLNANKEAIAKVEPGMTMNEFENLARNVLIKGLKELNLIKEDSEVSKYYYHRLGHSLGLDVHDPGNVNLILPGMVLTVEPGLYIASEGIGIRIEDNILITEKGAINLSANIIKEIADIENFMAKGK